MFKPLADRVLIKLDAMEVKSPGGIILPQSEANRTPNTGTVVAVGPDCKQDIRVNDYITWGKFAGLPVKLDLDGSGTQVDYLVMREADIVAVIGRALPEYGNVRETDPAWIGADVPKASTK